MVIINDMMNILMASVRVGAMLMAMPILGVSTVPAPAKIILSLMIGTAMAAHMGTLPSHVFFKNDALILVIAREIGIGIFIGLCARLAFAFISMCLEFCSTQMGLSMANMFDPSSFSQVTVLGQFGMIMGVLIFFSTGMHHHFIIMVSKSYASLPIGLPDFNLALMTETLLTLTKNVFEMALRISMPIIVVMLVIHSVLGIIAKTAPQMNLFFNVAITLNAVVGILLTILILPQIFNGFMRIEERIILALF